MQSRWMVLGTFLICFVLLLSAFKSSMDDCKSIPKKRISLVFYGYVDKTRFSSNVSPISSTIENTFPTVKKHIINVAMRRGYSVDIYATGWSYWNEEQIRKVYQPKRMKLEKNDARDKGGKNAFDSQETAIKLRQEFSAKYDIEYEWEVHLRYDLYLLQDFDFHDINPSLFYFANFCGTIHQWKERDKGKNFCTKFQIANAEDPDEGMPDWIYASITHNMERFFVGMNRDLQNKVFAPTASCCAHAASGGRKKYLEERKYMKFGRYKTHNVDFTLWRLFQVHPSSLHNVWLNPNNEYDWKAPRSRSCCGGTWCGEIIPQSIDPKVMESRGPSYNACPNE